MMYPVVDLHSDLLSFLAHQTGRSPDDPASRSSYSDMRKGNVMLQTLAIFARTAPDSIDRGCQQIHHFRKLLDQAPSRFALVTKNLEPSSLIYLIPAFENASAFCSEIEPLNSVFLRLQEILNQIEIIFYITITWDGENRFGGGVGASCGLKHDGKCLLEWLSGKRIAIDLSHASDKLAHEIVEYIDKENLTIPLMASHSNFRHVTPMPRNLPDSIAKEIIRRKGIIGLTFFAPFIHKCDPSALLRHVEYALSLGGEQAIAFGSDFFCDTDFSLLKYKYPDSPFFFEEHKNASVFPHILAQMQEKLSLSSDTLSRIAHKNAQHFLNNFIL